MKEMKKNEIVYLFLFLLYSGNDLSVSVYARILFSTRLFSFSHSSLLSENKRNPKKKRIIQAKNNVNQATKATMTTTTTTIQLVQFV